MAIREIEIFHGIVFFRLANCGVPLSITPFGCGVRGFYLINGSVPLYVKHTSKRLSPWAFSFAHEHQDDFLKVKRDFGVAYVIFVCGHDGVCCMEFDQFKQVLDHVHDEVEWVRISRGKKESYSVKGSDGQFRGKISDSDFPAVILERLGTSSGEKSLTCHIEREQEAIGESG